MIQRWLNAGDWMPGHGTAAVQELLPQGWLHSKTSAGSRSVINLNEYQ
jgi:hypothetical protein